MRAQRAKLPLDGPLVLRAFLSPEERELLAALASSTAWEPGRQGTGYEKLALAEAAEGLVARALDAMGRAGIIGHDRYLLRYGDGASVPAHVDPPLGPGLAHVRLNAIVAHTGRGGVLSLDGVVVPLAPGDAVILRPDRVSHAVSRVQDGLRLVFSVGLNRAGAIPTAR